jgi:hypothetical protein
MHLLFMLMKKLVTCFVLENPLKNLHAHLLLYNFLISKVIHSPIDMWCVHINGNTTSVTNTLMLKLLDLFI